MERKIKIYTKKERKKKKKKKKRVFFLVAGIPMNLSEENAPSLFSFVAVGEAEIDIPQKLWKKTLFKDLGQS